MKLLRYHRNEMLLITQLSPENFFSFHQYQGNPVIVVCIFTGTLENKLGKARFAGF